MSEVMDKKEKLVPELRFKEFDGEWSKQTLRDLTTNISYGVPYSSKKYDGSNKYLRITDIDEETRSFVPSPLTSPDGVISEKDKLRLGDIVFTRTGASVGKSYLYRKDDGDLIYAGFLIKFHINKADPYFVFLLTFRYDYDKWVKAYSVRSGQPGLNAEEYRNLKINIPSLPEQQKIADFLSAVDQKIQQLQRKKELLTQYKKGMMHKLFSQEIRFKPDPTEASGDEQGDDFPEWEEKKLGEFSKFLDGKRKPIKSSDRSKMQGIYPYYGASGIIDYVNNFIFDDELILLGEDGENILSRNLPLAFKVTGKCWINNHAHVIKPSQGVNIDFLTTVLELVDYRKFNTGTAQPKLNQEVCKKISLELPCEAEQQKIADFLSALDEKLAQVGQQIEQAQRFKKGLLQKMFV